MSYDIEKIREDFPQLSLEFNGKKYTYLDSAASTLKPKPVIERLSQFYSCEVSNVHRGAHHISHISTLAYEEARNKVAQFVGADSSSEIIFTRSTTESINLAAHIIDSLGLEPGDEIILSEMEHHSNIIPWQQLAEQKSLTLKYISFNEKGDLNLSELDSMASDKTKVISICHVSNTLGTVNDVCKVSQIAKKHNAFFVLDAAQSVSILPLNVKELACDFLAFSAHKLFAPFGVGVLWGKKDLLDKGSPYQGGGSMIVEVEKEGSTYLLSPQRYEAGTPNVGGVVALATAIDYIIDLGLENIEKHEQQLLTYATEKIKNIPGINLVGTSLTKKNVLSFNVEGLHHSDLSQLLDQQAVAVRAGHHCTQLIMKKLKIPGTLRASFSIYNNKEDVDRFIVALNKAREMLL